MRLKTKRQKCCKFPQKSTNNRDNYLTLSHNSKRQSSVDVKKFGSIPTSNRSGRRNRPTSSRIHESLEPRFNSPTSSGHHQTKQHHNRVTTWTRQESYGAHPTDKGAPQAKRTGKSQNSGVHRRAIRQACWTQYHRPRRTKTHQGFIRALLRLQKPKNHTRRRKGQEMSRTITEQLPVMETGSSSTNPNPNVEDQIRNHRRISRARHEITRRLIGRRAQGRSLERRLNPEEQLAVSQ
ncbi:unnamed protein product [Rhodiola kirilowii]